MIHSRQVGLLWTAEKEDTEEQFVGVSEQSSAGGGDLESKTSKGHILHECGEILAILRAMR
jgi:hypothetical protein